MPCLKKNGWKIERQQAEQALKQQLQRLAALHAIDQAIAGSSNLSLVFKVILEQVASQLGVGAADILQYDPILQLLRCVRGIGFRTDALEKTRVPMGQGPAGRAALERRLMHIPDLQAPGTVSLRSPAFALEGFVTYFGVPLIAKGKILGVLEVFQRAAFQAPSDWLQHLDALAGQAAIAIDSATLFEDLQRSNLQLSAAYDATIEGGRGLWIFATRKPRGTPSGWPT